MLCQQSCQFHPCETKSKCHVNSQQPHPCETKGVNSLASLVLVRQKIVLCQQSCQPHPCETESVNNLVSLVLARQKVVLCQQSCQPCETESKCCVNSFASLVPCPIKLSLAAKGSAVQKI